MINKIPSVIYDRAGNRIRVIKAKQVFFKHIGRKGYIFHIEREDRITSISEFNLTEENGKYIITRDILTSIKEI